MLRQKLLQAPLIGALLLMAAGCGWHHQAGAPHAPQALTLTRSLTTIPVYLPSGQETVLNADTNPIVATTYQNTPFLKRLVVTYDQVSAPKRPIIILITDPGTDKIHQAVQRVVQAMAWANATVPWALQIGPRNLYVGAQPTLLTDGAAGTAHRIVGSQAIVQALPQVAALPKPPRVHAHRSSQGQKTTQKG